MFSDKKQAKRRISTIIIFIFLGLIAFNIVAVSSNVTAKKYTYSFVLAADGSDESVHGIPVTIEQYDEISGSVTATGTEDNGDVSLGTMTVENYNDYLNGGVYGYEMAKIYIFGYKEFEYYCRSDDVNFYFVFKNRLAVESSVTFNYDDHKFDFGSSIGSFIGVGSLTAGAVVLSIIILPKFKNWRRGL